MVGSPVGWWGRRSATSPYQPEGEPLLLNAAALSQIPKQIGESALGAEVGRTEAGYGRICCEKVDRDESTPPAEGHRHPPAVCRRATSVDVQDCAEAAVLGEQRIAAEPEQVEVERLVGLLLVVALDFDGDGFRRLAGGEGQRAGLGDIVLVARCGGAVH